MDIVTEARRKLTELIIVNGFCSVPMGFHLQTHWVVHSSATITEQRNGRTRYSVDLALGSVHKRYKMDFRVDSVPKIYIKSADNLHSMHVKGVLLTLFI